MRERKERNKTLINEFTHECRTRDPWNKIETRIISCTEKPNRFVFHQSKIVQIEAKTRSEWSSQGKLPFPLKLARNLHKDSSPGEREREGWNFKMSSFSSNVPGDFKDCKERYKWTEEIRRQGEPSRRGWDAYCVALLAWFSSKEWERERGL